MGLLETARDVKAGKMKLADVPEGSRKHVQRLIPLAGEAPKKYTVPSVERGTPINKIRTS